MQDESVSLTNSVDHELRSLKRSKTITQIENNYPGLCHSKLIIFINSKLRTPWTVIQTLIILYYVLSIPLRFPYIVQSVSPIDWTITMDYTCDTLLVIDLILNTFYFHITQTSNIGHIDYIRRPNEIFRYYTSNTQFIYDIIALIPFELIILFTPSTTIYFILFRLNKLFRFAHLITYMNQIEKYINKLRKTTLQSASYRLIYLIVAFMIIVHWFACIWFTLGEYELLHNNNGWMVHDTPKPATFDRKYARSYYWATITLVTTGYGDIHPKTHLETIYVLFVMMVAVSLCTAIIASFASMFANGNIALWEHEQRLEVIQQYMQWKHLPEQIQNTVADYFHYLWATNDGIQEQNILNKIPWHLRKDIMIYMEGEALHRCSLFRGMDSNFIASLSMLLKPVLLSPGHYVYQKGQAADSMWLLYRGKCEKLDARGRVQQVLEDNSFIGETALLGRQHREESVRTITFTHLYVLKREDFESLLRVMTNNNAENEAEVQTKRGSLSRSVHSVRRSLLTENYSVLDKYINLRNDEDDEDEDEENYNEDESNTNEDSETTEYDKIVAKMKKSYESDLKMKSKVNKFFGAMDEAPPQKPRCISCCRKFECIDLKKIFNPRSSFMKFWNLLHFLIVFYSFIVYPYRSAFCIHIYRDWGLDNSTFMEWFIIDIVTDIFWYLDFYLRCQHFGHNVSRGSLKYVVYNPSEILLKYKENNKMRNDLISILPLEYILCLTGLIPMQYFSVIRCKVLIKWWSYLHEWTDFFLQQFEEISLNALRLVILFMKIVLFGHIVACIWYFIGFISDEALPKDRDYTDYKVWFDYDDLHFSTEFRRYIRSLYWSFITITTTGYGDIRGYTLTESWYAGTCVFLGGMVYYGAVGQISSLITKMSWMERNFFQRKDDLETFMKIKKLPLNITQRVRAYYSYMWDRQRGFEESAILNEFPRSLQSEVTKALNQEIVSCIPLFAGCDESVIKEITSVLEYRVHIPGDNIVSPNEMATEMFIVNRGWAEIFEGDTMLSLGLLSDGCWFGHTDFLTQARRHCYIRAITFCDISVLSVDDLCAVMSNFPASEATILTNVKVQQETHEHRSKSLKKNLSSEKMESFLGDRDKSLFTPTAATSASLNIIHPHSGFKTIWTAVLLCLMLFNCIEIPLFIAFVPLSFGLNTHFIITLILHVLSDAIGISNIWMNYNRFGYEQEGQIIVDPDLIRDRFWKNKHNTYELIAYIPIDYALLAAGIPLQTIAFVRCLRLISLSQFFKYTNWLQIKIQESNVGISTNLFYFMQLFVLLGLIAHWFGLMFFIIAKLVDDAHWLNGYDKSWIAKDLTLMADGGLYEFSPIVQYIRSFYWALSTMTVVCFGDITPQKDIATIYVTVVVIMCFFIVGNVIGNIGDLLGRIDAAQAELKTRSDQFDVFAASHSLPDFLCDRAKLYLNELYQSKKGINTAKIMGDFPPALRNQVMMHLFTPLLLNTAYFNFIEKNLIEKLSQYLQYELYVEHDFLCVYDEPADRIQILETGKVKILDQNNFLIATLDRAGDIIGDISFFLNAQRKSASVQAATFVECVSLNKDRFRKVFISCPEYLEQMKNIAIEKKKRIMEINGSVHNNLKRLVRKMKLRKFADLDDALPQDIREHLEQIESRFVEIIPDSPKAHSRLSQPSYQVESSHALSRKSTDILSSIFDEEPDEDINNIHAQRIVRLLNCHRAWDGFVAVVILLEAMLIWFRLCFYSAYKNDEHFLNSFILMTLLIEYIVECIFIIDIIWVKLKQLPSLLGKHRVSNRNFSFYCDCISVIPFEILLILPLCITSLNTYKWMIWCRAPKLLRLRNFYWNDTEEKEEETYIYKTSLTNRLTNLEKFLSFYSVPIFLFRYISFVLAYLMGAHYMGGLWYLTGIWGESYYSFTWIIRDQTMVFLDGHNNGVIDLYLRSTYFCLNAMTTTGYGDIACSNPLETVFLLILIIVSIIMFASMVGLFQNATMESDAHLARFQLQIEYTKSFMKRHRISPELHKRSLQHFQYVWNRSKGVDESAVLGSLPASLRADIVLFMNKSLLQNVTWFKNCSRGFVRSIATRLEQHLFLSHESIFSTGSIGHHMFFINEGIIQIRLSTTDQVIVLKSGDFFGHQSVIHNTPRTYTATASSDCELLSLSADKFHELLDYEPNLPQMLLEQDIITQTCDESDDDTESDNEDNDDSAIKIEMNSVDISSSKDEERRISFQRARSVSNASINSNLSLTVGSRGRRTNSAIMTRDSGGFFPQRTSSSSRNQRHSATSLLSGFQDVDKRMLKMSNASFDRMSVFRRKLSAQSKDSTSPQK